MVAAGPGVLGRLLVGRRVACAGSPPHPGTCAENLCTDVERCVPLLRHVDLEPTALLLVNPLTALAVLGIARRGRHRALVDVAAAGTLGRMITRAAARAGASVIAVVRRDEQAAACLSDGARHVLTSESDDFDDRLRRLGHEVRATLLLDPLAGDLSQRLVAASPELSTVLVCGTLEKGPVTLDPRPLLFGNRHVEGFFLAVWARDEGRVERRRLSRRAQRLLASDLATHVRERVPLFAALEAVARYRRAMSGAEVLLEHVGTI